MVYYENGSSHSLDLEHGALPDLTGRGVASPCGPETATPKDSRIWRYQDISAIGTIGPYQLRLTSMDRAENESGAERNFVFSLKERLEPEAYDFILWKINGPLISSVNRK